MRANKFDILILLVIAKTCTAGIILKSATLRDDLELNKATINIIKSCYENHGSAVGVVGTHISENLIEAFSSELIPVVLLTNSTRIRVEWQFKQRKVRYRLQVFVFDVRSLNEFLTIVSEVFETVWWNHAASFLLIYRSDYCEGSHLLLFEAFRSNMINAKVICPHNHKALLVSYNPYMNHAPKSWKYFAALPLFRLQPNNRFVLYTRFYRQSKEICDNIDFEKLKNLNGYPIQILTLFYSDPNNTTVWTGNKGELENSQRTKSRHIVPFISRANPKYTKKRKLDYFGKQTAMHNYILNTFIRHVNGTRFDVKQYIHQGYGNTNKVLGILFGSTPVTRGLDESISRPFIEVGLQVMTQHRGYMTQLEKIFSVVDIFTNIAMCIVLGVTMIFFKYFARHSVVSAFLNIIRIVCNTGFENLPVNTSSRLYLTTVLLFAVTMQGIYQGNLAALLTTEMPVRNVVTWQDLVDLGHTIYIASGTIQMFQEPEFKGRVIKMGDEYTNCEEYVLRNLSVACMNVPNLLVSLAEELNLHLSQVFKPSLGAYMVRIDWILEEQLNFVLARLFEADLIVPLFLREHRKELGFLNVDNPEDQKTKQSFRNMVFSDLKFAFIILGVGLLFASITFVLEIVIYRVQARIKISHVAVRPFNRTRNT